MRTSPVVLVVVSIALASLAAPSIAWACVSVPAKPLARDVAPTDIRFLRPHDGSRKAWGLREAWRSQFVLAAQTIVDDRGRVGRGFLARQDTLRLRTTWRGDGVTFHQDPNSDTTCERAGQRRYAKPRVLVRETGRAVFVVAVSRRLEGSNAGCITSMIDCTQMTIARKLTRPIGDRQVYVQHLR